MADGEGGSNILVLIQQSMWCSRRKEKRGRKGLLLCLD